MLRRLTLALVCCSTAAFAQELGLDLSAESRVKTVVLVPPIYAVISQQGSFAGFSAAKTVEKLDTVMHKKLAAALEAKLGRGKVAATDATLAALAKEQLSPPKLRTPAGMAQLAKATGAAWVIFADESKGTLSCAVYDVLGEPTGKAASVSGIAVATIAPGVLEDLAKKLVAHLVELSKPKADEPPAAAAPPPPEEEVSGEVESEIARERARNRGVVETVDLTRPRVIVAIGGGAFWRDQLIGGDARESLAQLRGATSPGLAAFAQVSPLHFIEALRDKPYSDLFVDVNYRRDFVRAVGAGSLDGRSCAFVDDELQARLSFRWKLPGALPAVGVGAGWAQERAAVVGCDLPVVSAVYRGIDAQLRVRQTLLDGRLALDLAFGPRALLTGPLAPKAGLSWAGEGWVEAKPASLLYLRGGARFFRAVMSDDVGVVTADVRAFFALEVGVHL